MDTLAKTTVTIPQEILFQARHIALEERITFSQLLREALIARLTQIKMPLSHNFIVPPTPVGKYHLGLGNLYKRRSEIYENYLDRKMGL